MNIEQETNEEVLDPTEGLDDNSIDMEAALEQMSEGLFPKEAKEEGADQDPGRGASDVAPPPTEETKPETPPEDTPPSTESPATETTPAPSTWSKDAAADWGKIPPRQQQEILKREQDFFNGLEQYKQAAEIGKSYEKVYEPYKAVMEAEGVNPVEMFSAFAGNHYLLSKGTPEQKLQVASNLIQHYGINPNDLVDRLELGVKPDPNIQHLQSKVQQLETLQQQRDREAYEQTRSSIQQQLQVFAEDPNHPHFQEVVKDMAVLLQSGAAESLQEAYDKAVFMNPVTRQKELSRMTSEQASAKAAEDQARKDKIAKAQAAQVRAKPSDRDGTVLTGTMDDTLEKTYQSIQARG